jgi:cell division protein FtsL
MDFAKLKQMEAGEQIRSLLRHYGRSLLGLFVVVLLIHNIFGAHGFVAMRRTQKEIAKVQRDIDRLNSENSQLQDDVKALRTDPHRIEKIARDELFLAKPGEIIINLQQPQAPAQHSSVTP